MMNFKEFYRQAEGHDINEGPRGRKVGEFLGSLGGLAGSAIGGAAASASMLGSGADDSMFGASGAPGGLLGTGVGMMAGKHYGAKLGGSIGDKVGDGMGWLKDKLFGKRKPKGDGGAGYLKKLTGDRDLGADPDGNIHTDQKLSNKLKASDATQHLTGRTESDAAAKTLALVLGDKELNLGYTPAEISNMVINVGPGNRVLSAWKLHKYDQMIADSLKDGHPGTARMLGKRAVEKLQELGVMPKPKGAYEEVPDDENVSKVSPEPDVDLADPSTAVDAHGEPHTGGDTDAPNITQPTAHHKQGSLFGDDDEPAAPKPKRVRKPADPTKPKRSRRKLAKDATPGLFDDAGGEPEPGRLF